MAGPTRGGGDRDGIDRPVLEVSLGGTGAVLETGAAATGRGIQDVRQTAPVPSQIQPWAAGTQERLCRRGTDDQTLGGAGTDIEFRAGTGTAAMADRDTAKATTDA